MADLFSIHGNGAPAAPLLIVKLAGAPRGKGRPRFRIVTPRGKVSFAHVYTDANTAKYEEALGWQGKAAMRGRPVLEGPLAVRIFCMMPIPASWPRRDRDAALVGTIFPTGKPDGDNMAKIVGDALNGIVWEDDSQVARWLIWKEYAEHPGLIVEVFGLP